MNPDKASYEKSFKTLRLVPNCNPISFDNEMRNGSCQSQNWLAKQHIILTFPKYTPVMLVQG